MIAIPVSAGASRTIIVFLLSIGRRAADALPSLHNALNAVEVQSDRTNRATIVREAHGSPA
jgi:hypothetical protein